MRDALFFFLIKKVDLEQYVEKIKTLKYTNASNSMKNGGFK